MLVRSGNLATEERGALSVSFSMSKRWPGTAPMNTFLGAGLLPGDADPGRAAGGPGGDQDDQGQQSSSGGDQDDQEQQEHPYFLY